MRLLLALALAGCASSTLGGPRFRNAPPVELVNDRIDVAKAPRPREPKYNLYFFDGMFGDEVTRPLDLRRPRRALGVNALDEVPDSTWFTNRIGVREMSLSELRRGPIVVGSPEPHKPWKIVGGKAAGRQRGFMIEDARGEKFLLKFEPPGGIPEAETAADVIVGRLLWAFGYNVPEDCIVRVRREDLVIGSTAKVKDPVGRKRKLVLADVDAVFAALGDSADGSYRALTSRILDGKWLGGHPDEGRRSDDPNDRIPHELRRDLRGGYAIFAWLDHVDLKEMNTLDMWQTDPVDPSRHYVKHYLIDFGKSLGLLARSGPNPRVGFSYGIDYRELVGMFVTGGLWERPWQKRSVPTYRGLGAFEARSFDPGGWKALSQVYLPVRVADRFDNFWSTKILMRFTREQLRAVVELGQLSDPRAVDYLVDTLVARQRKTGAYWFARVNPLDQFAVRSNVGGDTLCFDDLALSYDFAKPAATSYTVTRYDRAGHRLARPFVVRPGAGPRSCTRLELADPGEGYTIVKLTTTRPGFTGATLVHVARDPISRAPRVIGVWRQ